VRFAPLIGLLWCVGACVTPDVLVRSDGQAFEVLVVDVDGDGIDFVDADAGVVLDLDETVVGPVGWTLPNSDDAFLLLVWSGTPVRARDILGLKIGPPNGFEYLMAALQPPNENPRREAVTATTTFDSSQLWFGSLVLWSDSNQDATVQEEELTGFRYAGFVSIEVPHTRSVEGRQSGNQVVQRGTALRVVNDVPHVVDIVAVRLATR